jgi:hypothetical protein
MHLAILRGGYFYRQTPPNTTKHPKYFVFIKVDE